MRGVKYVFMNDMTWYMIMSCYRKSYLKESWERFMMKQIWIISGVMMRIVCRFIFDVPWNVDVECRDVSVGLYLIFQIHFWPRVVMKHVIIQMSISHCHCTTFRHVTESHFTLCNFSNIAYYHQFESGSEKKNENQMKLSLQIYFKSWSYIVGSRGVCS